jgi:ankyrin repeat protein
MSLDFAPEVIDFLLQNGSQITETNSEGNNLVIFAIKTNNINKLHYVLSKSPESLHKPSFEGKNAWHFLIRPNDLGSYLNKEIATELVNHKLCLNTADKFGHSPLDYCLSDGYFEFAEFLTGLGAKSLKPITKTKT